MAVSMQIQQSENLHPVDHRMMCTKLENLSVPSSQVSKVHTAR